MKKVNLSFGDKLFNFICGITLNNLIGQVIGTLGCGRETKKSVVNPANCSFPFWRFKCDI